MGFNENFLLVFRIVAIIVLVLFVAGVFPIIKKKIISDKNKRNLVQTPSNKRMLYNILSILCILIVGLSWFTNLGWIRVIFAIPMIFHAILLYFSNNSFHRYNIKSTKYMNLINNSIYGTYLLCYTLLPDGGDTEDSIRVFFGLVKNEIFINVASVASELFLVANIVLIIIQIIHTRKVKRGLSNISIQNEIE